MRALEQASDMRGVSWRTMMENAGAAAAEWILKRLSPGRCAVLCGRGNNGGDGYVVARLLMQAGVDVTAFSPCGAPKTELAALERKVAEAAGVAVLPDADANRIEEYDVVIDALFGTGFHGVLPPPAAALAQKAAAHPRVVALDLPSGLNADSPVPEGESFWASFTLCFAAAKPACLMLPAAARCGEVVLLPIGIPPQAWEDAGPAGKSLSEADAVRMLPKREITAHKGDFGKLLAVCGSAEFTGAAVLSALSALRCGAGLVTVASIPAVTAAVGSRLAEATFLPLIPTANGRIASSNAQTVLDRARRSTALLAGCGLGRCDETARLVRRIILGCTCPLILDADALEALAEGVDPLLYAVCPPVLTPHVGEMARLTGLRPPQIKQEAPQLALCFAKKWNAIVVLKDASTVVASPDGRMFYHTGGNPGLARGGSGDVLAGIIASLVAQGIEPVSAAAMGVALHGAAARRCAEQTSQTGMLAHEVANALCGVFLEHGR